MSSSDSESEVESLKVHMSGESALEKETRAQRIINEYGERAPSKPILVEHDRCIYA